MESKFRVVGFLVVFFLVVNVAGNWMVNSGSIVEPVDGVASERKFTVENVDIYLVNKGNYNVKIVDTVEASIKQAAKVILVNADGTVTPHNKSVKISLAKSDDHSIHKPAYSTNTIYNPDELFLEDWNFYETMLHSLFAKKGEANPFLTIGVGEYFFYKKKGEEIYSSHEMWIAHQRNHSTPPLKDLLRDDYFSKKVQKVVEKKGTTEATEASYWKMSSFAQYLIDQHGLDKFLHLYLSGNLKSDIEATFGKSLVELEKDWNSYTKKLETAFPAKFNYQLAEDYKYWYEN